MFSDDELNIVKSFDNFILFNFVFKNALGSIVFLPTIPFIVVFPAVEFIVVKFEQS